MEENDDVVPPPAAPETAVANEAPTPAPPVPTVAHTSEDPPPPAPVANASADPPRPEKMGADELVRKHLADVADLEPEEHPESHRLVVEHAEEAALERWQLRALLARFHAHGLHIHARIHPEVFKAALHEALHGRL